MSDPMQGYIPPPPKGTDLKVPILFGLVIALMVFSGYMFYMVYDLKNNSLPKLQASVVKGLSDVRDDASAAAETNRRHFEKLGDELVVVQRQALMAAGQTKADVAKSSQELAQRLQQVQQDQRKQGEQLNSQIAEVRTDVSSTAAKVGEVKTEVGAVRTDVQATKAELDKTIASLKSTQGDLGVQSGLIATNAKELAALKALGERNYFEFKLGKTKAPQRVSDVSMMLRKTDPKKNVFSVDIVADDKLMSKKDKTINEPLQFLVAKAPGRPYEIVVNEVKKDLIVGYLSSPKVVASR